MCNCGTTSLTYNNCGCKSYDPCDDCDNSCPIQLDSACVFYHKTLNTPSALINLGLNNGATVEKILEEIDKKLADLKANTFILSNLRQDYTINTIKDFAQAVDLEIALIKQSISTMNSALPKSYLGKFSSDPGSATIGQMWYNNSQSKLKIKIDNTTVKEILTA